MSPIKVAWYVLRVKNMHPGSPSDPIRTPATEAKPRCVYSFLKPHSQSSRCQVRLLPPRQSQGAYTQFQNHMVRVSGAKSDCSRWGKAMVHILHFKTTWSEFQKANQTATEQGNAERISNQNVCSPPQSRSQAVVCVSTPRKYPRSGYFLVRTIFKKKKEFADTLLSIKS